MYVVYVLPGVVKKVMDQYVSPALIHLNATAGKNLELCGLRLRRRYAGK
jgi:hypothetical protein